MCLHTNKQLLKTHHYTMLYSTYLRIIPNPVMYILVLRVLDPLYKKPAFLVYMRHNSQNHRIELYFLFKLEKMDRIWTCTDETTVPIHVTLASGNYVPDQGRGNVESNHLEVYDWAINSLFFFKGILFVFYLHN
jgi:hypothetical protein